MELAPQRLRSIHMISIAGAVILAILGIFLLGANSGARLAVLVLLVILLGVQVWLYLRERREPAAAAATTWTGEDAPAETAPQRVVIRCKQCGEVFPVEDTGVRPLQTTCPHCGKTGSIKVRSHAG